MEHNNRWSTLEEMMVSNAKEKRIPMNGSLELLPLCNMNCDMCYVRLSREEMEEKGRLRTVEEWIALAREMQEAGVLFLLLTGGEPFLYPDFRKLYLELQKLGFILSINSNGTMIDEDLAAFLGEHKPRRMNITLYGADEKAYEELCHYPGGFEKAIRGIRLLKKQGVDIIMNVTLTKANKEDLDRFFDIAKELDVPLQVDTYMVPATRERNLPFNEQSRMTPEEAAKASLRAKKLECTEEKYKEYVEKLLLLIENREEKEEIPEPMVCLAGKCSFTINWQGELRPCVVLSSPAADVFEEGFLHAWEIMKNGVKDLCISGKCNACKLRILCDNCVASALHETGDYGKVPEYLCRYSQTMYELLKAE